MMIIFQVKLTAQYNRGLLNASPPPSETGEDRKVPGLKGKEILQRLKRSDLQLSGRVCPHLAVVVDSSQCQRGPGELEGLEVKGGASGSLAFDGGLVSGPLT